MARMAGPAIRTWHFAEELTRAGHDVRLTSLAGADRSHDSFPVAVAGPDELRDHERWMDVLVFQGGLLRIHPFMADTDKPVVADVYDPFHLENLESSPDQVEHLTGVVNDQLLRGDFFVCASDRQRDFWLGSLAALGRVNGPTYADDSSLRRLIGVVPFGLSADPPRHSGQPALRGVVPGIDDSSKVLLWAGGVYSWFDPITLVRAVEALRPEIPELRLHFLGLQHPNPAITESPLVRELRRAAGPGVTFNEGWVDYDRRADFLLEADVGVSTHLDHIETAFSFRTRILDYLWAGLPIVTTAGDSLAELVERHGLGATAPAGDVEVLAGAIRTTLDNPPTNVHEVAAQFTWPKVVEPLLDFCASPRRAPDADADAGTPRTVSVLAGSGVTGTHSSTGWGGWVSRVLRLRGRT